MPKVVASLYHDLAPETLGAPEWTQNGNIWITLFTSILVPLCFLKHLHSLRHTSYVALFSVGMCFTERSEEIINSCHP